MCIRDSPYLACLILRTASGCDIVAVKFPGACPGFPDPKGSSAELVSELMGGVRMNILLANNPREKYAVGDTLSLIHI